MCSKNAYMNLPPSLSLLLNKQTTLSDAYMHTLLRVCLCSHDKKTRHGQNIENRKHLCLRCGKRKNALHPELTASDCGVPVAPGETNPGSMPLVVGDVVADATPAFVSVL